jgi:prephenate dehydrogenase
MKVAIVGGAGKMGRWVARLLLAEKMDVVLIGRDAVKLSAASSELKTVATTDLGAARSADLVILSVPMSGFEQVVKGLAKHVKPGQTIVDLTSVKSMPVDVMHKYLPNNLILGVHPVFGPGAESLMGHNVVLTPTVEAENALAEQARMWLETRGAKVRIMTPAEHDEMMAVVLGLAHFIAIVSGDTLLSLDKMQDLKEASGVTFRLLMTMVGSVLGEDPELYASIQANLPALPGIEKEFIAKASDWAVIVKNKDTAEFARRMRELKTKMEQAAGDSKSAYADMYLIAGR